MSFEHKRLDRQEQRLTAKNCRVDKPYGIDRVQKKSLFGSEVWIGQDAAYFSKRTP